MPLLVHYLAYGSNLHPIRLNARVPSARIVGVVEMLGCQLAFHKRSIDGSGKCLIYTEQGEQHKIYGVLYEFDTQEKAALDALEGNGKGYIEQRIQCRLNGKIYTPYLYGAQSAHIDQNLTPYHWYKNLVLAGCWFHNFPAEYIAAIKATPSQDDSDLARVEKNEQLLEQMTQTLTRNPFAEEKSNANF